jgi:hypothetical protein
VKRPAVLVCFSLCLILAQPTVPQELPSVEERSDSVSPDKQWEYKCVEYAGDIYHDCKPEIVRPGTSQLVLDLGEELEVHRPEAFQARIVWAPDSKRFALNYSPLHAHHTTYETIAFYQLRDDKWTALRAPEDAVVQFAKKHMAAKAHRSKDDLVPDVLKVREWADSATVTIYAIWYGQDFRDWTDSATGIIYAIWDGEGSARRKVGYSFALRFVENGDWKIFKTRRLLSKDVKEFDD